MMRTMLKRLSLSMATVGLSVLTAGAAQAGDLSISVGVAGEVVPGMYGRVNVTNAQPRLIIADPMIVRQRPRYYYEEPLYLSVPPRHVRHWGRYCDRYDACGRPVYFVRSPEYDNFRPTYIQNTYVVKNYNRPDPRENRWDEGRQWREENRGDWDRPRHGHHHGHGRGWD